MAKHEKFQRVIAIHVQITESPFKFYRDHYQTSVSANTENGTMLLFSAPITIKGLPPEQQRLRFAPISSIAGFPITIISKEDTKGRGFAQIQLSRPLKTNQESAAMEFYLGAFDINGDQLANCKVTIKVQANATGPPKFDASHYFTSLTPPLPAHLNVIRVHARAKKSIVTYHLTDDNSPFDVAPFSGDIFTKSPVPSGKYELVVIAKNSNGQESTATVTVVVEEDKSAAQDIGPTGRLRRQLSDPVVIKLKENSVADFPKVTLYQIQPRP
ncbi:cadherin domain protein [Teladorsagia circumcincta]|uniref:Cadherin domain protein n=1 Tax=Teladorsagia circumcincta TaxID=45464 RepID=A0A2G9UQR8_TELCI|nr:cadherin domain protein [Teladorsagia circumcincta]